ncbi:MAG: type VI secretion system tip protein VgrG [Planctomycetes bacterium]|nr:type VI secretion system tip protein VgrG [Planctomycetota bacterium]
MPTQTQANRSIAIATPLGDDVLLLVRMTAREQFNQPFSIDAELLTEDSSIVPADLLRQNVTLRVNLRDGSTRWFNGHVAEFRCLGTQKGGQGELFYRHAAVIRPWIWLLDHAADCRIHQDKTAVEIVKQVFTDRGFTDVDDQLTGTYRKREVCVQYRESDLAFVSRLLEEEGIAWHFSHTDGNHKLVLTDSATGRIETPGYEVVEFRAESGTAGEERISSWRSAHAVQPGSYSTYEYDFEKPELDLNVKAEAKAGDPLAWFDHAGGYKTVAEGKHLAALRLAERKWQHEVFEGAGDARGLGVGARFELRKAPDDRFDRQYLIVGATLQAVAEDYGTGRQTGAASECQITAIDAAAEFRPVRRTPRGHVAGPQTGLVLGPDGEEIHTDKFGRVKVRFFWDRHTGTDESKTCWVRVAQIWAGNAFGGMHLPRVGSEVVVTFLEGDPDRPLVIGQLYNGTNATPYPLPANKTLALLKSSSSKGGSGFNEIRFEDKAGSEQLLVHAQKDLHLHVLHDRNEQVGNDQHLIVKHDRFDKVTENHHDDVGKDRKMAIGGKLSVAVKGDRGETVEGDMSTVVTKDLFLKGQNVVIEAGTNLTLKVGGSSIAIEAGGITIKTSGPVEIEGSTGKVKCSGPLDLQGAMTTVQASGITAVKGAMVQIN